MQEVLKFFHGGPIFNLLGFLFGIIGIVLSIYYYIKSKREKKPLYDFETTYVLYSNPFLTDIEIKYKGQVVEKLQLTKLSFWNGGKEAIRKSDLTNKNPIVVNFDEKIAIYKVRLLDQRK